MALFARRSLRLRTRVVVFFAFIALLAGVVLIVVTYGFARSNLVNERRDSAERQARDNATIVSEQLTLDPGSIGLFFEGRELRTENDGFATLRSFSGSDIDARTNPLRRLEDFPPQLVTIVRNGGYASQFTEIAGSDYVVVGLHLEKHDAGYFEAFTVTTATTTLTAILTALGLGAAGTLVLATLFGFSTSRRLLQPLSSVADAAEDIASGGLDTRLEAESDPDLDRLARSFNDMADAVQARIEREARFASDVSHELRSPITALTAAVEVLDGRREELPDRTRQALDVVVSQVRRFDSMVIDLLELSRIDAGASDVNVERLDVIELVRRIAARHGASDVEIDVASGFNPVVDIDKVRFERVFGNLLDNANNHGDGVVGISVVRARNDRFRVVVDDSGPGVARGERERIFERFARGSAARHRVGTGLGLALVREHAEAMGGATWVDDRPGGGARFVVELPRDIDKALRLAAERRREQGAAASGQGANGARSIDDLDDGVVDSNGRRVAGAERRVNGETRA